MARTLLDLSKRMHRAAAKLPGAVNDIKKQAAKAVARDLIVITPVDTSRALSNWIAQNGASHNYSIMPHVTGKHGSTKGTSASTAIAQAMRVIDAAQPNVPIFITNNLRYIRALNDGHSKQAPAGFVERSVLIGRKTAERSKLKV